MPKPSIDDLMDEIKELTQTVMDLRETVDVLSSRITETKNRRTTKVEMGSYKVVQDQGSVIEGDVSWTRLVGLLRGKASGLTASELANKWGKSRSRTSEVLNRLVEEGQLIKYRDGRSIKFRARQE
ncbi:MAG: helix-turn-helix domain-containing protein [Candidatus Thorarchaeota archaeon]